MPQFRDLEYTTDIETSDQVAIWKTASGQPMRGAVSALVALNTTESTLETVRSDVADDDLTISLTGSANLWLIITQEVGSELTSRAVTMNFPSSPDDGQEVTVSYRPTVFDGDGFSTMIELSTSPAVATQNQWAEFFYLGGSGVDDEILYRGSIKFRYDETDDLWYEF